MRRHFSTLAFVGLLAALVIGAPASPVEAQGTPTAEVGMPFDGKWAWMNSSASQPWDDVSDSHPAAHHIFGSAEWAVDVYANGVDVYPTVVNASGPVTLKYAGTGNNSCSTPGGVGAWVRVNVHVGSNQTHVGTIQYGHLDTSNVSFPTIGSVIQPAMSLGKTKFWNSNCWGVTNAGGVHTHLSGWNAGSGYSCYLEPGQPGANTLSKGTAIGRLGSANTGTKQVCAGGSTIQSSCIKHNTTAPTAGLRYRFSTWLPSGQTLYRGDYIVSENAKAYLVFQHDGNIVLYGANNSVIWQSGTGRPSHDRHRATRLVMQTDGNLVSYDAHNHVYWHSHSAGNNGAQLKVQGDGNLVVYGSGVEWQAGTGGTVASSSHRYTNTLPAGHTIHRDQYIKSSNGRYVLMLQTDGNLVLYGAGYHVLCHTDTANSGAARLTMQSGDGNLVLYDAGTGALWNSESSLNPNAYLQVQHDGNAVVYEADGSNWLWQSETNQ